MPQNITANSIHSSAAGFRWRHAVLRTLRVFGVDPLKAARAVRGIPSYLINRRRLRRQAAQAEGQWPMGQPFPCLGDRFAPSGTAGGHYFHQDLLVARRIFAAQPERHVDIGSRIDGFVAHIAAFRTLDVFDIRPMPSSIPNVRFRQLDLMQPLPEDTLACCDSLSCLHALEHFGLGRYGDSIDFNGHRIGFANLGQIVAPGGIFYLSVPIGPQRIEFDAHRVFSMRYLLDMVDVNFRIEAFSYVDDRGDLHESVPLTEEDVVRNFGCRFGCGILELRRR